MHVKNVRPYALEIGPTGQVVEPGEIVEVEHDIGASLLEQPLNWQTPEGDPPIERPAVSAPKADWVAYAVAVGFDRDEAEALTKDELVALYTTTDADDGGED
jgi:hypothetical protein